MAIGNFTHIVRVLEGSIRDSGAGRPRGGFGKKGCGRKETKHEVLNLESLALPLTFNLPRKTPYPTNYLDPNPLARGPQLPPSQKGRTPLRMGKRANHPSFIPPSLV